MIIIILIGFSIYSIIHLWFLSGYFKSANFKRIAHSEFPFVSVVVAARNEESNIGRCINSLKSVSYPESLIEILLVNDRSTDSTLSIMKSLTEGDTRFRILETDGEITNNLKGKPKAIDLGIRNSKGEIIIMTDADCTVRESWVEDTVRYYDEKTAMVAGFTKIRENGSVFTKLQAMDWVYLQSIASGSSGIKQYLSCIGNNLSFRKSVYFELGGFEGIKFSITEDLATMKAISKIQKYDIKYPVYKNGYIETDGCKNLSELYRQKKRWFKGGTDLSILGYLLGISMYITNIVLISGFIYLSLTFYLILVGVKILSDIILTYPFYRKLNMKDVYKIFPLFEVYFMIYGLLLPFTFLFGLKVNWKGRNF
jgi:cellulose synthase/poly-beta-1,6-N-acetylglucosamine synthase-like glycosyltransferase